MNSKIEPPKSFRDIINHWSSIADFANALNCKYQTARKMNERNSVAPKYWEKLSAISDDKNIYGVNFELFSSFCKAQEPAE